MESKVMFEGIATLTIGETQHDTYMVAHIETVEDVLVRWYGTVGWIAEAPKKFKTVDIVDGTDVVLSDGRRGTIHLNPHADDGGKFEFQGMGLPPGFEPLYTRAVLPPEHTTELVAELRSTTPSGWRVWVARVLCTLALVFAVGAIWAEDNQLRYFATAGLLSFIASFLVTSAKKNTPIRTLPEIEKGVGHDDTARS